MIGHTHEQRIENWLKLFGIDSENKDVQSLRKNYQQTFLKYSSKNGFFTRWEIRLKRNLNYKLLPSWIKTPLRLTKRAFGFHREK